MTAAIKQSINNLYDSIVSLENEIEAKEKKKSDAPKGQKKSADLFSFAPSQQNADTKALASRLDGAIAKVEKLLQEG
ncbi:MAG: hypothetical protein AAF244_01755 [Pseudomonadota bacterium]